MNSVTREAVYPIACISRLRESFQIVSFQNKFSAFCSGNIYVSLEYLCRSDSDSFTEKSDIPPSLRKKFVYPSVAQHCQRTLE